MAATASLVEAIDALLPQTQCTKCGYDGCRPYAEAIASGTAALNRCPPGGAAGIAALAALLGRAALPLDPACGREGPRTVAVIDEARCIGCTLCIQACPVDAIVGAPKQMHTVLAPLCTGCDLCIPPCPVDCIAMHPVAPPAEWSRDDADAARARHAARRDRLARERAEHEARLAARADRQREGEPSATGGGDARKRAVIEAALARARARRQGLRSA